MAVNRTPFAPIVPTRNAKSFRAGDYRRRVLVVDDESVIADSIAKILTMSDYAAIAAYDAESALETALLSPPELLITDVLLPGMSGIDLAITIKRIYPDCRILLFSGQASTADLLGAARREGHHFTLLSKPLPPREMLAVVALQLGPFGIKIPEMAA